MKRFLPTSVAGQAILILIVGLTVSHVLSMLIYAEERIDALAILGGRDMSHRVANVARLISDVPQEWRHRIIDAVDEANFRVILSPQSLLVSEGPDTWAVRSVRDYIEGQFQDNAVRNVIVQMIDTPETQAAHARDPMGSWMPMHMWHMMQGVPQAQSLRVSIQLSDGEWINFFGAVHGTPPLLSKANFISTIFMVLGVLLVAAIFVARLTKPLRTLGHAAKRIGRDVNAAPLEETGQDEVRHAIRAFNDMQKRLKQMVENRARMLAAISHDLRTPLTLLKLRTEMLDSSEDQDRMLATIDEMEAMIGSTLEFARKDADQEETRDVDIAVMLEGLCADFSETGADITYEGPESLIYACRPLSVKRAISNVLGNAITYGEHVWLSLSFTKTEVTITIDDDGPGIPDEMIEQAFTPFFRVEESRNLDTGGVGLGLSVARTVIDSHGGSIALENREEGGLRARVVMPV